ncbi:MAG TPA: RlmE family RNA methyltransferase, partial [Polyangium sp.]|nr:RlmE family RNA methyltransferase [Polyangium sp.]
MKNPYKKPDAFTKAAKAQGFPARSVFKLEEIDRRVRLFKPGQRVLDLGAAPGSWSMYASQKVGAKGRVFAVDISEIRQALGTNVTILRGDALSLSNEQLSEAAPYDIVLSDMAPSASGQPDIDHLR